jgi:hypothetical protein
MKKIMEKDFDAIWNSVQGMQRAEAPNYLYNKLRNRLETQQGYTTIAGFRFKPIFVLGMLALCMLVNLWMLNQQTIIRGENITSSSIADFSAEYGLNESYPN